MAKVLLVNPIIRKDDKPRHIPFGLAQLAAIISQSGHQIQVFDCGAWRPTDSQIRNVLNADDWDVVGIGGLVTSYGFIKDFVRKTRDELPGVRIILGGGVITPIPRDVMSFLPEVDIGVVGEGWVTMVEVLEAIDQKSMEFSGIPGIAWRDGKGGIIINPGRDLLEEVDSLPFPAWEMFPLNTYFANSELLLSEESMASRRRLEFCCSYGCPYKCKYCFHLGLSGELAVVNRDDQREVEITKSRRVRWHSPEYVVELAAYARDRFGADFIAFLDENFVALDRFTKGKWMDSFEELWLKSGLQPQCIREGVAHDPDSCSGIHWGTTCHAALASEPLLERLRNLGCGHLDFGFESFSDDLLKEMGKGATRKMNIQALKTSMKVGIRAIPNQIIGFPTETLDSLIESLETWIQLGIRSYPFLATPYPGSEWYSTYKEKIIDQYDGNLESFLLDLGDATDITAVISENFNYVELLGLRELMTNWDLRRLKQYRSVRGCPADAGR